LVGRNGFDIVASIEQRLAQQEVLFTGGRVQRKRLDEVTEMVRRHMKFLLRLIRSGFLCLDIMQCRQLTEELLQVWLNLLPHFSLMRFPESAVETKPLHEARLLRPDLRGEIPGPERLDTP